MNWKKPVYIAAGLVAGFVLGGYLVAQQPDEQTTAATTQPTAAEATTEAAPQVPTEPVKSAEITPDARTLLDELSQAYKSVKTLSMKGTVKALFDVGGENVNQSIDFTADYASPNKFRFAIKDALDLGSTGEKVYIYSGAEKVYKTADAPKDALHLTNLMYPIPMIISRQNPSLMLLLSDNPAEEAILGATKVSKAEDTTIDDTAYPTLHVESAEGDVTLVLDPSSHLLRRMAVDMKKQLSSQGEQDVKEATVTFDYSLQDTAAAFAEDHFNWTPPADARDAATLQPPNPSDALLNSEAPGFTLKDFAGADISLATQKGNVVVLDFWATWCPPCVVSLPELDTFAKSAGNNVKVFAVNLQEDQQTAQKFMKDQQLSLNVLLDTDGAVAMSYKVQTIPSTIVIGKDGKVAATFLGAGQQEQIEAAVKAALAQ